MSLSLLDNIRYKHERVGLVQKDGKTYVKYRKIPRFKKLAKNSESFIFGAIILLVLGLGIKVLQLAISGI